MNNLQSNSYKDVEKYPEIEKLRIKMYEQYEINKDPNELIKISQKLDQVMNEIQLSIPR